MTQQAPNTATQDTVTQEKVSLRAEAKALRSDRTIDSAGLCAGLRRFLLERNEPDRWTLVFLAMPGEPDLAALVSEPEPDSRMRADRFATTRTPARTPSRSPNNVGATDPSKDLTIHPLDSEFERHPYGYQQPVEGSVVVDDRLIGVVFVPGLAFDLHGGRIGFGAGYYDRLLRRLIDAVGRDRLAIVGISDGFMVDRVPMQDHDIDMTHLATSTGVIRIEDPLSKAD